MMSSILTCWAYLSAGYVCSLVLLAAALRPVDAPDMGGRESTSLAATIWIWVLVLLYAAVMALPGGRR